MIFLEYPKCSTCKKAKKWLDENGIKYDERHIKDNNPTFDELFEWTENSGIPVRKLFNTSGVLYREMQLKDKLPTMTDEEMLKILSTDGMLVKRPLIIDKKIILVGFKENKWENKLLNK